MPAKIVFAPSGFVGAGTGAGSIPVLCGFGPAANRAGLVAEAVRAPEVVTLSDGTRVSFTSLQALRTGVRA